MKTFRNFLVLFLVFQISSIFSQNNCLEFGGVSGYVDCGSSSTLKISDNTISVEAWIYPANFKAASYLNTIVSNDYWGGSTSEGYVFRYGGATGDLDFTFAYNGGGYNWASAVAGNVLVENKWQHVAAVYDGSTVKLYVNGIGVISVNLSYNIVYSTQNLNLGRSTGDPTGRMLEGRLDEVRIWGDARTESEIRRGIYAELSGIENDLLAYYQFNETTGSTLPDIAGSNTGTLINLDEYSWKTSAALFGPKNCLDFNGSNDHIQVPTATNLEITNNLTLEFWFNADSWGSTFMGFISKRESFSDMDYELYYNAYTSRIEFYWNNALNLTNFGTDINPETGSWHHIAVTKHASGGELYLNGVLAGSHGDGTAMPTGNPLWIGTMDGVSEHFDGKMDEVRIWSNVRTVDEIRENMMRGLTGNEDNLVAYYTFDNFTGNILQDFSGNGNDGQYNSSNVISSGIVDWTDYEGSFRDYDANWTVDALIGKTVYITTPGKEQSHIVYDNSDIQLWLDPMDYWSPVITGGETYEIVEAGEPTWQSSSAYSMWLSNTDETWAEESNWSLNEKPQPWDNVGIFALNGGASPVLYSNIYEPWSCNNMVIGSGITATIPPGNGFDIFDNCFNYGTLLIKSDASGTGSLRNYGVLEGNGSWQSERYLPADQWTNFSPPFNDMISGDFELPQVENPDVYLLQNNEATYDYSYITETDVPLSPMNGYLVWVDGDEATPNVDSWTFTFEGDPTTGDVGTDGNMEISSPGGTERGWNLVGNPYFSSIDWAAALGWTKTGLDATTYIYNASGGNWATYTAGSGAATNGGSRYIPPAQAFFVKVSTYPSTATLKMTNEVRTHSSSTYLKEAAANENLVKLQLSDGVFVDETVVGILENATLGFDTEVDAHKLYSFNEEVPQVYTNGPTAMAVNCIPEKQPIALGVSCNQPNQTLTIEVIENEGNHELYIEDVWLNSVTMISQQGYSFEFVPDQPERFVLHFAPVSTDENHLFENIHVFAAGNTLYVKGQTTGTNYQIQLYDILGQQVFNSRIDENSQQISLTLETGVYMVNISDNTYNHTQKVFVK